MIAVTAPTPTPADIQISAHAVEQFIDRVKPHLSEDAARAELDALKQVGEITSTPPPGIRDARMRDLYLVISDAYAFPLARSTNGTWTAVTCLVSAGISSEYRRDRSEMKARTNGKRRPSHRR